MRIEKRLTDRFFVKKPVFLGALGVFAVTCVPLMVKFYKVFKDGKDPAGTQERLPVEPKKRASGITLPGGSFSYDGMTDHPMSKKRIGLMNTRYPISAQMRNPLVTNTAMNSRIRAEGQ